MDIVASERKVVVTWFRILDLNLYLNEIFINVSVSVGTCWDSAVTYDISLVQLAARGPHQVGDHS
jgi:hypothetical protein